MEYIEQLEAILLKQLPHFLQIAAHRSTNYSKLIHSCCQAIIAQKLARISAPLVIQLRNGEATFLYKFRNFDFL